MNFDPVWGSIWGSIWDGSFQGSGGNPYASYSAYYPLISNVNNLAAAGSITTQCLSTRHVETTIGNVIEVAPNTAALTGDGMLVEGEGVNTFLDIELSNWNGFTNYTSSTTAPDGSNVQYVNFEDVRIFPNNTVTNTTMYTASCWIKANIDASVLVRNPAAQDSQVNLIAGVWTYIYYSGVTAASTTNTLLIDARYSSGVGAPGLELALWGMQLEVGGTPSSYVPIIGSAPTIRNEVTPTAPTSDVFVDDDADCGNLTEGNYLHGLNTTGRFMAFYGGGYTSKYAGNFPLGTGLVGARFTSKANGAVFTVESVTNEQLLRYMTDNTEQEIQEGFQFVDDGNGGNDNKFTIDFSTSSMTLAEVTALRESVGDGFVKDDYSSTVLDLGGSFGFASSAGHPSGDLVAKTPDGQMLDYWYASNSGGNTVVVMGVGAGTVDEGDIQTTLLTTPITMTFVAGEYSATVSGLTLFNEMQAAAGNKAPSSIEYYKWNPWPADKVKLVTGVRALQESNGFIFYSGLDASNFIELAYNDSQSHFILIKKVAGVDETIIINLDAVYGDRYDIELIKDGANLELTINGNTASTVSATDIPWGNTYRIGTGATGGSVFNGVYAPIEVGANQ